MTLKIRVPVLTGLAIAMLFPAPVGADQIDGNWCRGLKHFSIDGPSIVTPGGTKMTGIYDRHGFQYVVPEGEPGAGTTITMAQQHDELVHVSSSAKPDEVQNWTPCNRQIS